MRVGYGAILALVSVHGPVPVDSQIVKVPGTSVAVASLTPAHSPNIFLTILTRPQ